MVEHLLSTHKAPVQFSVPLAFSRWVLGVDGLGWGGVAQLEESLPGMSKVLVLTPSPTPHKSGM